jgi:uncharacterized LabA/DUF88 family protein
MMSAIINERVMVFIDGSNLYLSCKRHPINTGFRVDIKKLVDMLVKDRRLIRPYYYTAIGVPPSEGQVNFHHKLQYSGITVKSKPLRRRGSTWTEKGVDVTLVIDLLSMGYRNVYDTAILVSGDKDFEGAVDEIKRLGKRIEIASFDHVISEDLKMIADRYISLDHHIDEINLII